tara:strand:- start:163 stop:627 length:465 start_codon:yes stop_codon:yes gene_type:complete
MKLWCNADGKQVEDQVLFDELKCYIKSGGKIYVGSDSMLYSDKCSFASVIALHDVELKVAKYYFKKQKEEAQLNKNLKAKILNEVSYSVEAAQKIIDWFPEARVEIHVDIGNEKQNLTRSVVNQVRGWIQGIGFDYKIKPNSWASSSIADWHTK